MESSRGERERLLARLAMQAIAVARSNRMEIGRRPFERGVEVSGPAGGACDAGCWRSLLLFAGV